MFGVPPALNIMSRITLPSAPALTGILSLLFLSAIGCNRSSQQADTAPADVRGEPIRAEATTNAPSVATAPPEAPAPPAATPPAPPAPAPAASAAAPVPPPTPAPTAAPAPPAETPVAAAATNAPTPAPGQPVSESGRPGFASVTFDRLASFNFIMPEETVTTNGIVSASSTNSADQIPLTIKALSGTPVGLKGFMLPLKVESGLVTEMLLMRDQSMCCYGKVPKINEWVTIKMKDKGVKAVMDQPVTIFGKLHVGEMRENGYLVGIYRMDGEGMGPTE